MTDFIQFRFVPTMRCNLRCSYCFLEHSSGNEPTMFDKISPAEWIEGIKNFSKYDVEFYMWGGEPFCIDGTYEIVKGFSDLDFVSWARIDSNIIFTHKIIRLCPSEKVKINCAWHTEAITRDKFMRNIKLLKQHNMLGMVNFVASDVNLQYLRDNNLDLLNLVRAFHDDGIFLNVAADFRKGDDPQHKDFVSRFTSEEDWLHMHLKIPPRGTACDAANSYFSVDSVTGNIVSCGAERKYAFRKSGPRVLGNFFSGKLRRRERASCPQKHCPSIVSYCHRLDNAYSSKRHLEDYVKRNTKHRLEIGTI